MIVNILLQKMKKGQKYLFKKVFKAKKGLKEDLNEVLHLEKSSFLRLNVQVNCFIYRTLLDRVSRNKIKYQKFQIIFFDTGQF